MSLFKGVKQGVKHSVFTRKCVFKRGCPGGCKIEWFLRFLCFFPFSGVPHGILSCLLRKPWSTKKDHNLVLQKQGVIFLGQSRSTFSPLSILSISGVILCVPWMVGITVGPWREKMQSCPSRMSQPSRSDLTCFNMRSLFIE